MYVTLLKIREKWAEKSRSSMVWCLYTFVSFCDSNVSLARVRINGRISHTSSLITILSSDSHAPASTDQWMDEWMHEWMDEWTNEWMNECKPYLITSLKVVRRLIYKFLTFHPQFCILASAQEFRFYVTNPNQSKKLHFCNVFSLIYFSL